VLRTLLVVAFLVLAMVAPVWMPFPAARPSAVRPVATRFLDEDEPED
jgi:hypothetical protein